MRSLSLIVVAAVSFGALALSGCTSCMQPTETKKKAAAPPPVTCGAGTVVSGTQCVGLVK